MSKWYLTVIFFLLRFSFSSADFYLTILHNNDMHARFEQTSQTSSKCSQKEAGNNNCYGGFARVAYAVKEAKRLEGSFGGPPVIFLNAGDTYQGTVWFTIHKWKIVAKLSSMLGIDASSLGNHEFDDGVAGLVPFINNVTFPVLAANLDLSQEPTLAATHLNKSVVLNVKGRKVGVVGYLTTSTKDISSRGLVKFNDEVESVRREAEALKRQGVNIIIALGHAGYNMDQRIAKEVADVDVVVGGHSHTFLYNGEGSDPTDEFVGPYPTVVKQSSGKLVPVVQAYAYTKYLGNLTLQFNNAGNVVSWKGNPILLDKNVPQDEVVLKEIEVWREAVVKETKVKVGISRVLLNGDRRLCRTAECNLGNLIADSMIDYYVSRNKQRLGESWSDAPIAVVNSGGIRGSVDTSSQKGFVSMGDLLSILPFDNALSMLHIKGTHLLEMLEWSVYNLDFKSKLYYGAFLQVSGLQITYDICRAPGHRVVLVMARCGKCWDPKYEPVNSSQIYGIIVPEYLANNGNGYTFGKKAVKKEILDITDTGVLGEYIKKLSPVYPSSEGRIKFLDTTCENSQESSGSGTQKATTFVAITCAVTSLLFT